MALAEAGADLVLGARRKERLMDTARAVEALGRRAVLRRTDVASPEDCAALVQSGLNAFGQVNILVNNAGVMTRVPAIRETPEQFHQVIAVNLEGAYWMAQACGRVMGPGSSIVNIVSVLGMVKSTLPQAAYAASKAGLIGLTRDLAQQWTGRRGIRVNALAPGYFMSEMTQALMPLETTIPFLKSSTPMGRIGQQHELDTALIFLASDASSYITGVTLPVDGGLVMP
jgi:NAD(P)-dependent dehydrogenase (short-subunit alcohol dehydrogenase family)